MIPSKSEWTSQAFVLPKSPDPFFSEKVEAGTGIMGT